MNKRNRFWILILIGVGIVILLMIVSSAISLGEKLRTIHPYVEYGFYIIYAFLVYFLIVNPIRIILFAPTFSITTTMEENNHRNSRIYKRVAKNIIQNNVLEDEEVNTLNASFKNNEDLRLALNQIFNTSIKKEIRSIIIRNATTVMISTAISQNGRLDMLTVLSVNLKMIKEIVLKCGFRPSYSKLGKLSINVIGTALVAETLEGLDFNDVFPQSTANFLAEIPLVKPIASSLIQGMSNALLTLRIGFIARRYLFSDVKEATKTVIRREAIKESMQALPIVMKDVLSFIPNRIVKLFTKKPASTEQETI
ncbi:MAG: DUF697 domain-containing protein [Bacilli bacterium]